MNAIDTNVLVYSLDADEPAKQAKAKALLAGLVGAQPVTILTWQVAGVVALAAQMGGGRARVGRRRRKAFP